MTYAALLIDNLHGDLLEMHLQHLGDFMVVLAVLLLVVLAVVERSLRGPPRTASCATEA
jgi:hypothetical protein